MTNVSQNGEVAPRQQEKATHDAPKATVVNLEEGNLPSLEEAREFPVDLMSDYWTPENPGETKRVYFDKIANREVLDQESGEVVELECAYFLEQTEEGVKTISNGSKRLVGALSNYEIKRGTPLQITYKGKKRNRSNQYMSDNWSIKILTLNV